MSLLSKLNLFETPPYPILIMGKQSLLNLPGVLNIGTTHSKRREQRTGVIREEAIKLKVELVGRLQRPGVGAVKRFHQLKAEFWIQPLRVQEGQRSGEDVQDLLPAERVSPTLVGETLDVAAKEGDALLW